jgi:hypothetical protein
MLVAYFTRTTPGLVWRAEKNTKHTNQIIPVALQIFEAQASRIQTTVSATRNVMFNNADYKGRVVRNKLFLCSKVCMFMNKRHDW